MVQADAGDQAREIILAICARPEGDHRQAFMQLGGQIWHDIAHIARLTRTLPLIAHALRRAECWPLVPDQLARRWHVQLRANALDTLNRGRAIAQLLHLLRGAGFHPIGLKGLSLAFRDYPDPALRVLRDIDLLLPPDAALAAEKFLHAQPGYRRRPGAGHYGLEHSHQLPEIEHEDSGLIIELHHAAHPNARQGMRRNLKSQPEADWGGDPQGDLGAETGPDRALDPAHDPAPDPAGDTDYLHFYIAQNANSAEILGQAIRVPSAEANFLHLVEHASVHHLFANGPLVLADLHFIATRHRLDWAQLQQAASQARLGNAMSLLLAMAHQYGAGWMPPHMIENLHLPRGHIAAATRAIVAGDEYSRQIGLYWRLGPDAGRIGRLINAACRMVRPNRQELARYGNFGPHQLRPWLGYPAWLAEKALRYFRMARDDEIGTVSLQMDGVKKWLELR